MGKIFSFRYALLLSVLLFSALYIDYINLEYDTPNDVIASVKDPSMVITPSLIHKDKTLNALGKSISLGDSAERDRKSVV